MHESQPNAPQHRRYNNYLNTNKNVGYYYDFFP